MRIWAVVLLCAAFLRVCGSSAASPAHQYTCAIPATSSPPGGGIPAQIQIDPASYGAGDTSRWTTVAFQPEWPRRSGGPGDSQPDSWGPAAG